MKINFQSVFDKTHIFRSSYESFRQKKKSVLEKLVEIQCSTGSILRWMVTTTVCKNLKLSRSIKNFPQITGFSFCIFIF